MGLFIPRQTFQRYTPKSAFISQEREESAHARVYVEGGDYRETVLPEALNSEMNPLHRA